MQSVCQIMFGTQIALAILFLFHFPVSPSFFYLLYFPPTSGLSLCWHRGTHGDLKGSGEVRRHDPAGLLHHGQRDSAPGRPAHRFDTGEAGAVERGAVTPLTLACASGRTPTSMKTFQNLQNFLLKFHNYIIFFPVILFLFNNLILLSFRSIHILYVFNKYSLIFFKVLQFFNL